MKILGAKPFGADSKGVEAAETARIHASAANSVLGAFAVNMGSVITSAVSLCARWRGIPEAETEEWEYGLNTDYSGDTERSEGRRLALDQVSAGVMSRFRFLVEAEGLSEEDAKAELARIREEEGFAPEREESPWKEGPDTADADKEDADGED